MCNEREVTAFAEYVHTALLELGEPKINFTPEEHHRFWSKVDKGPHPKGCWTWTKGKDNDGYGIFVFRRQKTNAHRVSLRAAGHTILNGMMVCHRCDNPSCVNPDHLLQETHTYNMRDKVKKGRGNFQHGEKHTSAKLTDAQVLEIKSLVDSNSMSQHEIAAMYNVAQTTVSKIKRCSLRKDILQIKKPLSGERL